MRTLLDFLNHGALPFTGREREMDRLLSFWRSTPDANGLRALLLIGEAGIGKSRLIEELLPRIHRAGGLVVHTKLLPESAASIVPLIARSPWYSEAGRHLLKKEPEENLGSVLAGLRRLARLRPTLLVIEDIHLLHGAAVGELWGLLDGLADETLSLLCDARPLDLEARGLLERYLVEEIELEGLGEAALRKLWLEVFNGAPDGGLLTMLGEATAGNPLAIRSALRGALASGAIDQAGGSAPVRFDKQRFALGLKRDVALLTEGMAAHLSPEERQAAGALALLGEAFARETAEALLDDATEAIERLIFRGIVGIAPTPTTPLVGRSSEIPSYPATRFPLLSFSHTLVHRYFADRATVDRAALLRIIGSDLPLYSLLPLQLLEKGEGRVELEGEMLRNAITRIRYIVLDISNSPDWKPSKALWDLASQLLEEFTPLLTPEEQRELMTGLVTVKLSILANEGVDEEYHAAAKRLLEMTANPQNTQDAARMIAALAKFQALDLDAPGLSSRLWLQAEELVEQFPDLRFTHSYGLYLALVASTAIQQRDAATARLTEGRLKEIASDERGRAMGSYLQGWILSSCITVYGSQEELEERLTLLDELEHTIAGGHQDLMLRMGKLLFLDGIGYVDDLLRSVEQSVPRFREYNWTGSLHKALVMRLRALAAIGMGLEEAETGAERLLAEADEDTRRMVRTIIGAYLVEGGILAGATEWAEGIDERYPEGREIVENATALLLALERGELPAELPQRIGNGERGTPDLAELLEVARAGGAADHERAATIARRILESPVIRIPDLLLIHASIRLLERIDAAGGHDLLSSLRSIIHDALTRALEWLAERRLPAYMASFLDRYEGYYTAKELKGWRSKMGTIARERRAQMAAARGDGRIRISMLGTIAVEHPDGEAQRVQGARLRSVLGLMVANQMMGDSLSGREFYAIAADEETPEKARNVVYVKLHNLREMLGEQALITETDRAPRLNTTLVQVDLLVAHDLLDEARAAMREGALLRAYPAMLQALELTHGEVPFPGLYEEFFEAAREDFENQLRDTAITVMRGLLREDDLQSAEEIARRTFDAIPDDEEIGEILCEALTRRGKRTEAERVRRRVAEGVGEV